jgi:cytochrome c nitrite reductase small subunit
VQGRRVTLLGIGAVAVSVLAGAFMGVSGFTFYYAEGASYLSNNPQSCVNCHIMREQYDSWHKSSHHAVATCNDCHLSHDFVGKWMTKAKNGYWHSTAFTFQNFHEPIQVRQSNREVLQASCLHCHGDVVHQMQVHAYAHESADMCTTCHQGVGHGQARQQ